MHGREHLLAVVEATPSGEAPLEVAHDIVARGGRATVVFLINAAMRRDIAAFAAAEDLAAGSAEAIAINRLSDAYARRIGGEETDVVVWHMTPSPRALIDAATASDATSIAVPQDIARHRHWRALLTDAPVPVVVTPLRAA